MRITTPGSEGLVRQAVAEVLRGAEHTTTSQSKFQPTPVKGSGDLVENSATDKAGVFIWDLDAFDEAGKGFGG